MRRAAWMCCLPPYTGGPARLPGAAAAALAKCGQHGDMHCRCQEYVPAILQDASPCIAMGNMLGVAYYIIE
jgi:hypothetical protein